MTGDALRALGGIEAVGTVTGLSTGCEVSSAAGDTWVTGAMECVISSDRSVAILSAYGRVRATKHTHGMPRIDQKKGSPLVRRTDGLRRHHL
jgi:hypothetical protein